MSWIIFGVQGIHGLEKEILENMKFNSIFFVHNQSQTNFCFKDSFFVFHLTSIMLIQSIIVCE